MADEHQGISLDHHPIKLHNHMGVDLQGCGSNAMSKRPRNKGGRRAYLKRFSSMSVPSRIDSGVLDGLYGDATRPYGRAQALPRTRGSTSPLRERTESLHALWKREADTNIGHRQMFAPIPNGKVEIVFSGNVYWFVKTEGGKEFRSMFKYEGRYKAEAAFFKGVRWIT